MSMVTQQIDLDLVAGGVIPVLFASQYDTEGRTFQFNVYANKSAFTIPSGVTAKMEGTKPDKKGFSYDATVGSGNIITIDVQEQMTAVAGRVMCELVLISGTQRVGSANFFLLVEPAGLAEDVDTSETVLPEYISGAQRAAASAEESATAAEEAAQIAQSAVSGLYPTDTASGNPAVIVDGADNMPVISITPSTVTRTGKNLLPKGSRLVTRGITFEPQTDGSVLVTGTATGDASFSIVATLPAGTYIGNGVSGGSASTYYGYLWDLTASARAKNSEGQTTGNMQTGNDVEFVVEEGHQIRYTVTVKSGMEVEFYVYPMMRPAVVTDATYAPYVSEELSSDITTMKGVNCFFADGSVTVEYRADIGLYIDKKLAGG